MLGDRVPESWDPLSVRSVDPIDAMLMRGDELAGARSTMLAIYVLDDVPNWQRVLAAFDRASRSVPRLRHRVVSQNVPLSLPYWVVDPHFDLEYHVRRARLTGAGRMRDLLDLAQLHGTVPLDRTRPLWEATLVEGLDPQTCAGRAALMLKASHAVGDGIAGMEMALALFDVTAEPNMTPLPEAPPPEHVQPVDLARLRMQQLPAQLADLGTEAMRRAAVSMNTAMRRRPHEAAASAFDRAAKTVRWTRSFARTIAPVAGRSPVWGGRGQRRRYSVLDVPLAALRQAGKAAGGSVNDAYVAGVLGGIRLYHEKSGTPIEQIAMAVPVSLRTAHGPATGNRFAGARFGGPAGEPDPAARIARVHDLIEARRAEPALDALRTFAPVIARLPNAAFHGLRERAMSHDIQVSNIPGYPVPVYLAGQQVLRVYPFGPVPGVAAMITLVSHVGVCYVGVNVDPDAVRDPALFDTCLQQGFAEVLVLADGPAHTDVRG